MYFTAVSVGSSGAKMGSFLSDVAITTNNSVVLTIKNTETLLILIITFQKEIRFIWEPGIY